MILIEQLADSDFSIAECTLIPRFFLAIKHGLGIDELIKKLAAWFARCAERIPFGKALPKYFPGIN